MANAWWGSLGVLALAGCTGNIEDPSTGEGGTAGLAGAPSAGGHGGAIAGGPGGSGSAGKPGAGASGSSGHASGAAGAIAGASGSSGQPGTPGGSGGAGGAMSGISGQSGSGPAGSGPGGAGSGAGGEGGTVSGGSGGSSGSGGTAGSGTTDPPGTWRSVLYPQGWLPLHEGGKADAEGRFLHDFSYAGYHRGEVTPPYGKGAVVSTVDPKAGDSKVDATKAIQAAIDAACAKGGGVVHLPAGTYRIKLPTADAFAAVTLGCSHLVLRGDGPTKSRLLLDDPLRMRNKTAVAIRPSSGSIFDGKSTKTYALTADAPAGTRTLAVADTSALKVGDWIAVRNESTPEFRAEHRMDKAHTGDSSDWWETTYFAGLVYPRQITQITGTQVELDAPTRYELKTRDKARVYALPSTYLEETGIESLGIGMVQNTTGPAGGTELSHEEEYSTAGTTAYEVHSSRFLDIGAARDGWIHDVASFVPSENTASGVHLLSNGLLFTTSAFRFTISDCSLGRPEYRGGGGNGYLYHVQGNDLLFADNRATDARHGFTLNQATSGNVFLRTAIVTSRYSDDSHRFLSQANLYDSTSLDQGWLSTVNRGSTSSGAGFTSTAHVFWNTHVVKNHASAKSCAVETAQWSWGYVIGTRADSGQSPLICTKTVTNGTWAKLDQGSPTDFAEGEGKASTLHPSSLYEDQRARRCQAEKIACDP